MKIRNTIAAGILLASTVCFRPSSALGKPPKTSQGIAWEYAFVTPKASRSVGLRDRYDQTQRQYGVKVRYANRPEIFLAHGYGTDEEAFLLDVLTRMGSKGWELVSVPVHLSSHNFILKRRH